MVLQEGELPAAQGRPDPALGQPAGWCKCHSAARPVRPRFEGILMGNARAADIAEAGAGGPPIKVMNRNEACQQDLGF